MITRRPHKIGSKHRRIIAIVLSSLLLVSTIILSGAGYQTYGTAYRQSVSLAQVGMQHLRKAQTLLAALPQHPLDTDLVNQARDEFVLASTSFGQIKQELDSLPWFSTWTPVYGARLGVASHLVSFAVGASRTGIASCTILSVFITEIHNLLSGQGEGLTGADFSLISQDFREVKAEATLAIEQVNQVDASDVAFDPMLSKSLVAVQKWLPTLQTLLADTDKLLPLLPALLGIGSESHYLIEVLDSTELRPGGGVIGQYAIATLSQGRLTVGQVRKSLELDRAFQAANHSIPLPTGYAWFPLPSYGWSFSDANLDADFPTAAQYGEQAYIAEGGNVPLQGVIAITPALIQQALVVTGPIDIPEYHETVTPQNLVDRLHYYYQTGGSNASSSDGSSSSPQFITLLAEKFLNHVRQLSSSAPPMFFQLMLHSLRSKDIQLYINADVAEKVLRYYQFDASVQLPNSDSLFVVDANIARNKANNFIVNTVDDQITLDVQGTATHQTTISYAWTQTGDVYGDPLYRDYVHIYAPPNSLLQVQTGWQPQGTSQALGHAVWAGILTLPQGETRTITLIWTVPGAAKGSVSSGWHYDYLVQRQAGSQWTVKLHITLPICATVTNIQGGLLLSNGSAIFSHALSEDTTVGMDYKC